MRVFKFLASGAVGPFSRFPWPMPVGAEAGAWVEASGALSPCVTGLHVCRASDLAYWLSEELWEVETDGETSISLDCLVVRRARLVRHVDAWLRGGAKRFAEAACQHAGQGVKNQYLDDAIQAQSMGFPAVSAYSAALAVTQAGDQSQAETLYRDERAWQSDWIVRNLIDA